MRSLSLSARLLPSLLLVLATSGCEEERAKPAAALAMGAPLTLTPALREEARVLYASRCATCHGTRGAGDGSVGAGLVPRPRNLQDAAWQASVTDEYLDRIISEGGLAVGRSALMPPSPDLRGRPALAALRAHVRSFAAAPQE